MNFKTNLPTRGGKIWRNSALLLALIGAPMLSFLPVDSKITGRVFRDFNANGVFDTTPIEIGVPDVTVTAYTPTGSSIAVKTGADGTYSINTVTGTKYRIEFTDLQTGDFESAYRAADSNNGTSVQFAASGDVNVNLGVNYPAQYSSTTNPKVVTSGFINGDQTGNSYRTSILWSVPFNSTDTPTKIDFGTAEQYGSVWGTAYAKTSKKLYVAAFTKRNVGFGPLGPGAIYVTQTSGDVSATAPARFYDFPDSEVGGSKIHGTLGNTADNGSEDNEGFDNVGKTSLGDIEVSEDEKDLYVINLFDRTLNKINIATGTKTATIPIPTPGSGIYANDYRPFALKVYRGKVYVGVVMTNEHSYKSSTYSTSTNYANDKGDNTGMNAAVLEYNGTGFTKVLDFPLTYTKQPSDPDHDDEAKAELWRPWTSTLRLDRGDNPYSYPQAWLTNIEFDVTGEMILGIRDRFGDQMGYNNLRPSSPVGPGTSDPFSAIAPGEILRAGKSGATWTIEAAGVVNGVAATASQKSQVGPPGPGGKGKFYWGDVVGVGTNHGSSSLGGLALLAGSGKVIMTAMDPNDVFNTGGIKRLINAATIRNSNGVLATAGSADDNTDNTSGSSADNITAGKKKGAIMYSDGVINWGKANGMGDVELLTAPAPIEIGNRIWIDKDSDGIQDGDEAGLAGVSIQLLASNGTTVLATAVTDADGNYIFSNAAGTNTSSLIYGLTTLAPGTNYTLRILDTSGPDKQTVLTGYKQTGADKDTTTNGDTRDSDGIVSTTSTTVAVTTGNNGENNHSFDFGFAPVGSIGDYVWYDANHDGLQAGESAVPNVTVTVTLQRSTDGGTSFTDFATTTTGTDGKYLFSDLESGTYKVVFTKPAGYDFTTEGTTASSNTDSNPDAAGASGVITINTALTAGNIGRDNLTIDAGLAAYGSIGDYIWFDTDKDGGQTSGEAAVDGVTVKLWKLVSGSTYDESFATTTTDANGKYTFSGLESGTYKVQFVLPSDRDFTLFQKSGVDAAANSDAGTNGLSDAIVINTTLASGNIGRDNPTIDAGLVNKGALPVTLLDFNVSKAENTSLLKWSTTAETNSAYFEVQRSVDGKTWTTLGSVFAQGESSDLQKYDFTDGNPLNGENLYRLKMVDADQSYAYSRIISIKLEAGYKLSVFPNPTSDVVKIETSNGASVQKVQVYSLIGKLVKEVVSPKDGEISVQQLPTGMYMLKITTSNGSVETRKVIVAR